MRLATTSAWLADRFRIAVALVAFFGLTGFAVAAEPSLDEMAGQMILLGFQGNTAAETKGLAQRIGDGRLGGVMYLKTNVKSLDDVRRMNAQFTGAGASLPPFIALDQEGGSIERLTKDVGFKEIPSAADIARTDDPLQAEAVYLGMAQSLRALGFNLNFGPVVDLNLNPANPIIAKWGRSYDAHSKTVADYASAFISAHRRNHVLTALKHFPGHGSSTSDSHAGFVDITKTWRPVELEPFRELIAKGAADMVMIAHLYHAKFATDPGAKLPASLSASWVEGVLRHQLGFQGVTITDDLEMGAIRKQFNLRESVVKAVRAGVDILLFSNTANYRPGLADEIRAILVSEAQVDPAFRARIEQSYNRIAALKRNLR